jgi:uncharacterized protein (TIGR03663 family)
MHTDEAVNAYKTGILLETGFFRYDPDEFHGPVLYYTSLLTARITGQNSYASLTEQNLRMVPAIFGFGLILLLTLLVKDLGWRMVLITGFLFSVSPPMVFYSRYYIHETLLAFSGFGAIISAYRFLQDRKTAWLAAAGIFLGLMHATKETCLISYGAFILALVTVLAPGYQKPGRHKELRDSLHWWHLLVLLGSGATVSVLFFSSFFKNPEGIIGSVTAFKVYLNRAGVDDAHIHPWYYYLKIFLLPGIESGKVWSDLWLIIPAIFGLVRLMKNNRRDSKTDLLLFAGFYSLLLLIIYSAIPYKTPWNIIQIYPGIILLSGFGITEITVIRTANWLKTSFLVLLLAAALHWTWMSWQLNFVHYADPANPYVYAHTTPDIFDLRDAAERLALVHPDHYELPVEVISPEHDYWPLPWYLRKFPNTGYLDHVDTLQAPATLIISAVSLEDELVKKLYEIPPPGERYLYVPLFRSPWELRPGVEMRAYLSKAAWDRYYMEYKE